MDSRPSDETLLLAVAERDMGAFRTLYERHAGWLAIRLARRCNDRDLVADAFGSLFFHGWGGAEVALLVADDYQGQGIGTTLAEHLFEYAAARGIRRLELTALAGNHRIIRLFRRCAPTIEFDRPEAGTVTATLQLPLRAA